MQFRDLIFSTRLGTDLSSNDDYENWGKTCKKCSVLYIFLGSHNNLIHGVVDTFLGNLKPSISYKFYATTNHKINYEVPQKLACWGITTWYARSYYGVYLYYPCTIKNKQVWKLQNIPPLHPQGYGNIGRQIPWICPSDGHRPLVLPLVAHIGQTPHGDPSPVCKDWGQTLQHSG